MTLTAGRTLGRYQIIELLGEGGMATVYRAFQSSLNREIALKVLRAGLADDTEFRERFVREAQSVARLQHPNIVQVFDFEEIDGHYLLAMELLSHGSLRDRLVAHAREGTRLARSETARIVSEVADALAAAHELGIVHRDIKPSNVLLAQRDRAVVADFGIAKIVGGTSYTQTGVGIGTPEYMSPEQAENRQVDSRADQYSLAVMAYEMVVGRVPFAGDTPLAVALAHIRAPIPPPSTIDPSVGRATEAVLLRALEKDPEARYAGTLAFASDLREALLEGGGGTQRTIVVGAAAARAPATSRTAAAPAPPAAAAPPTSATAAVPAVGALAGFWIRFLGRCIDLFWAACLNVIVLGVMRPGGLSESAAGISALISWFAFTAANPLSKPILGLRVVAADGSPLRVGRALTRLLAATLVTLPLGLGYLAVAFDRGKQGWHDKIAGTYVVHGGVRGYQRALSGLFLVLLSAVAGYAAFGPSDFPLSVARDAPVFPTPAPTAQPVLLRPDQVIMPLEEFPLPGFRVADDGPSSAASGAQSWRRFFVAPSASEYQSVTVYVDVTGADRTYRVSDECSWGSTTGILPTSSARYGAPPVGERSNQCRFAFADGDRAFHEVAASRNFIVNVWVWPKTAASDSTASAFAASLARQQIAIIDRVAPP